MAQLQAVGSGAKVETITERLSEVRARMRNAHGRLIVSVSRAGLLPPTATPTPTPTPTSVEKAFPEYSDLCGIVSDIESLCEHLTQDACEVEKIA